MPIHTGLSKFDNRRREHKFLLFLTVILIGLAGVVGMAYGYGGIIGGGAILGAAIGLPVVLLLMFDQFLGSIVMLLIGFTIQLITKSVNAPLGTSMDGLLLIMLLGMIVQQIRQPGWAFAKNPIGYGLLMWILVNLLQGLNPWAESKMAWLYTIRSMALLAMFFFIVSRAFTSKERVFKLINIVLAFGLFAALWGWKQEFFGFTNAERTWLYSDAKRFELIFQWTRYRIFSVLNDPTTFGIMMAYMAVMATILAMNRQNSWMRIAYLLFLAIVMTVANSFSGTRTSFVLVPIGFFMFVLLNPTKEVLISMGLFFLFGTAFIMKGSSNALIFRIQSAFRPTKDESMLVRIRNQQFIRPHIQSHPIGFGLGSCGMWGARFNPDSWLAKFPHDSGYVRIAVELGWIGLIIYLVFLVIVLRQSIYFYFRVKDPTIKNHYLALTVAVFMLMIANYPQEAIPQLPTSLVFYIFLAAIARLKDFDPAFTYLDAPPAPTLQQAKSEV